MKNEIRITHARDIPAHVAVCLVAEALESGATDYTGGPALHLWGTTNNGTEILVRRKTSLTSPISFHVRGAVAL